MKDLNQTLVEIIGKHAGLRLAQLKNWNGFYPAIDSDNQIIGIVSENSLYDLSGRNRLIEHAEYTVVNGDFAQIKF